MTVVIPKATAIDIAPTVIKLKYVISLSSYAYATLVACFLFLSGSLYCHPAYIFISTFSSGSTKFQVKVRNVSMLNAM